MVPTPDAIVGHIQEVNGAAVLMAQVKESARAHN
jgi:hypothetical protein